MTRPTFITNLILLILTFFSCKESQQREKVSENSAFTKHNKTPIKLIGFSDTHEVIYRTNMADFVFSRTSVLQYCGSKDISFNNNFIYKQVISYVNQDQNTSIVIYDTVGTKLVPDSMVNFNSKSDTLVRIRNQESPYSNVTEAIDWMLLDIITAGKFKLFEHHSNKFIDSIILDEVNAGYYGSKDILTKDGKKLFSKMTWIQ
jgi:hypothetical protein